MRILYTTVLFVLLLSGSYLAYTEAAATNSAATRIEVDEANNVIRIVIDGQKIGFIDKAGFYVHGDIAYTGTITDGLPDYVLREGRNAK